MLLSKSKEALSHILVLSCAIQCPTLYIIKNYVCIGGKVSEYLWIPYRCGTGNWGYRLYQNRLEPTFLGANNFWEDRRVSVKMQCVDQGQQGVRAIISL